MAKSELTPSGQSSQLPESKTCSQCGVTKAASGFYVRRRRGKVQLRSDCKECAIKAAASYNKKKYNSDAYYRRHQIERLKALKRDNEEYRKKRAKIDSRERGKRYASDAEYRQRVCEYERSKRRKRWQATPPWVTPKMRQTIRAAYSRASELTKATGTVHHVDHIVPIQGDGVCGLHVPWNLRVVTALENLRKGNRHEDWSSGDADSIHNIANGLQRL